MIAPHANACKVFACGQQYPVKLLLGILHDGKRLQHDTEYDDGQKADRQQEDDTHIFLNGKCHDHGTEYDERRTQNQTKRKVQRGLNLIYIVDHTRDQCRCPHFIKFIVRQIVDLLEHIPTQGCCHAGRRFRHEELRGECKTMPIPIIYPIGIFASVSTGESVR